MGKNCGGTGDAQEYHQLSADDAKMLQNAEPWVLWSLHEKKGSLEFFFSGFWSGITVDVYVYMFLQKT